MEIRVIITVIVVVIIIIAMLRTTENFTDEIRSKELVNQPKHDVCKPTGHNNSGLFFESDYNYDIDRDRRCVAQISNDKKNFRELVITGNAFRDGRTRQVGVYDRLNIYGELCIGNEKEQVCINMNDLKGLGRIVKNSEVGAGAF
jgi:hypothetical protein